MHFKWKLQLSITSYLNESFICPILSLMKPIFAEL